MFFEFSNVVLMESDLDAELNDIQSFSAASEKSHISQKNWIYLFFKTSKS